MEDEYIFAYGTLRRGEGSAMEQQMAELTEFVGKGWIQGRLYEIHGYPGAVLSDNSDERVHGEVFRLLSSKRAFAQLDTYEQCAETDPHPHEYIRSKQPVHLEDGREVLAWVYLYIRDTARRQRIESGDYLKK